ncbi:hypothetical protein VTK73DRAFT_1994 [Phialemonium thermophilum]|uniref:Uncharacterized protein n=1 Tax=Phialemonium thermophilum TaxID=223376 RepID=A0ABR3VSS3_9PEZI
MVVLGELESRTRRREAVGRQRGARGGPGSGGSTRGDDLKSREPGMRERRFRSLEDRHGLYMRRWSCEGPRRERVPTSRHPPPRCKTIVENRSFRMPRRRSRQRAGERSSQAMAKGPKPKSVDATLESLHATWARGPCARTAPARRRRLASRLGNLTQIPEPLGPPRCSNRPGPHESGVQTDHAEPTAPRQMAAGSPPNPFPPVSAGM